MLLDKKKVSAFTKVGAIILAIAFVSSMALFMLPSAAPTSSTTGRQITNMTASQLIDQGNSYFDNKQYKEASQMYEAALEKDPSNVDVRVDLAISYFYQNDPARAVSEALKGLEVNPNHAKAHFNLGIFYQSLGKKADARREYEAYLKLEPNSDSANYARQQISALGK